MKKLLTLFALALAFLAAPVSAAQVRIYVVFSEGARAELAAIGVSTSTKAAAYITYINAALVQAGNSNSVALAGINVLPFPTTGLTTSAQILSAAQQISYIGQERHLYDADVVSVVHNVSSATLGMAGALPATTPDNAVTVAIWPDIEAVAHEFGHLLGARHQKTDGVMNNDGANDSAHGGYLRLPEWAYIYNDVYAGGYVTHYWVEWYTYCARDIMAYSHVTDSVACNSGIPGHGSEPIEYVIPWYSAPGGSNVLRYRKLYTEKTKWPFDPSWPTVWTDGPVETYVWGPIGDTTVSNSIATMNGWFPIVAQFRAKNMYSYIAAIVVPATIFPIFMLNP